MPLACPNVGPEPGRPARSSAKPKPAPCRVGEEHFTIAGLQAPECTFEIGALAHPQQIC